MEVQETMEPVLARQTQWSGQAKDEEVRVKLEPAESGLF
jgi:hypothetical protein